jgi:phosphoglycolate phosphatase-like HAD superfamily hydrolase
MATSDDAVPREQIMLAAESKARRQQGIDRFDRVIYVGDGIWDFIASQRLAYRFIGVGGRIGELQKAGVEFLFTDYANPDLFLAAIDRLIS